MHDAKGRPLAKGDMVLICAKITELHATEDYCNVSVESVLGRRPDGQKETIHAINTGVMLRANKGDENAEHALLRHATTERVTHVVDGNSQVTTTEFFVRD